ncbi:CZB domain-containing protein [uncultured Caulobacter sp.]|uniref:CZB domain-containing protein n=1 Tax=uncultured Caulobacter sp. TaxID=158749 RepID=UPI002627524B|nr:CZB domain-containing protein [uncultured Caulobacter sp.]
MDFQDEALQHTEIRETLGAAISEQRSVDPKLFKSDRLCATGCWLHGEGARRWAGNHAFMGLLEAHRDFHARAGEVAELINRGQFFEAQRALRSGSAFALALTTLSSTYRRMKAAATSLAA